MADCACSCFESTAVPHPRTQNEIEELRTALESWTGLEVRTACVAVRLLQCFTVYGVLWIVKES